MLPIPHHRDERQLLKYPVSSFPFLLALTFAGFKYKTTLLLVYREVISLTKKEFLSEWKQKNSLSGILIYVVSSLFLCSLAFKRIVHEDMYNALFWVLMLFAAVNTVSRSFIRENDERMLYFYSVVSPQGVILSKIIYNGILLLVLALLSFVVYTLLLGNLIQDMPLFLLCLVLGSLGFSSTLTLVSAIAAKSGNNPTLMAILSFPIILPFLITLIALSRNAIGGIDADINLRLVLVLSAINVIVVILSYLLFPYLWRD
ncbi:heme exporter protein CcmB [bacterium SCSIO 12741]|nr:heme exporter protein CcmB [bacterium SCSIO 12741]